MVNDFQVIRRSGSAVLVEYTDPDGHVRRVTIPAREITDEGVGEDVLAAGIEYGADWEAIIARASRVTPEAYAEALRRAGYWTVNDLRADPNQVNDVLMRQALRVGDLLAAAESMEVHKNG